MSTKPNGHPSTHHGALHLLQFHQFLPPTPATPPEKKKRRRKKNNVDMNIRRDQREYSYTV